MEQWYPLSEQKAVYNSEVPQELELRIREDFGLNSDVEALYVKYGESVVSAVIKNTRKDVLDSELKTELRRITNNGRDVRPIQDVMKELDKKEQFRNIPTSRVQRVMNASEAITEDLAQGINGGMNAAQLINMLMKRHGMTMAEAKDAVMEAKHYAKNEEVEQNAGSNLHVGDWYEYYPGYGKGQYAHFTKEGNSNKFYEVEVYLKKPDGSLVLLNKPIGLAQRAPSGKALSSSDVSALKNPKKFPSGYVAPDTKKPVDPDKQPLKNPKQELESLMEEFRMTPDDKKWTRNHPDIKTLISKPKITREQMEKGLDSFTRNPSKWKGFKGDSRFD